jgi:hypothetical protein
MGAGDRRRHLDQRAQLLLGACVLALHDRLDDRRRIRHRGIVEVRHQALDDDGIELPAGAAAYLGPRRALAQRPPVRPGRRPSRWYASQARTMRGRQRDRLAGQAVGIALAVPALVFVAHGVGDRGHARQRAQDPFTDDGGARA